MASLLKQGMYSLLLATLLLAGCSDPNPEAPPQGQIHPAGWLEQQHQAAANADLASCQRCHGADFSGSGAAVSCLTCHPSAPSFARHPAWWNGDAFLEHRHFSNTENPAQRLSWTNCATAVCHGTTLRGGSRNAPSCFSASFINGLGVTNNCHAGGPPAPHATGGTYDDPALHGAAAKDVGAINNNLGNYCVYCHGRPTNRFDGGMVSDPAILNLPQGNCSQAGCHPAAKAHPTNWVKANNAVRFHSTISSQTRTSACALCHKTTAPGAGPFVGAPSCFSANFTNANAIASTCHATGPGGAPHVVPYTDPTLHGLAAKANLIFCQTCHAEAGGSGSNPRFNVPIGNLTTGCEGCHVLNSAHPPTSVLPSVDRWTFRGDQGSTRRTHFAAGNVLTACALCHGATLDGVGGVGPSCFTCHLSAPQFRLNCTYCHGTPPTGAADLTGSTPVAHGVVSTIALHEACAICHGANDDGSGKLTAKAAGYLLFNAANATLNQGGDHLDGQLEMNGPSGVGSGYNATNFGCDNACHVNNVNHRLPNGSGLTLEFGNYGSGSLSCNSCHGYPPDGNADLTGATPVNHLFGNLGATLKANHNDCLLCHGTKDDGSGSHSPAANYSVAVDHNTGSINMNSATQYDVNTFGCNLACHLNNVAHRLSDSGLPVVLADYGGGGGGGACAACHDTGVGGAPIVIQNTSAHAGQTCEGCHTGHNAGTVIIPNNPTVGINYTAAGHGNGISLGGTATTGTTEAQICWNCHANNPPISEWGTNTKPATGSSLYNYGSVNQASWVGAIWTSGTALFSYKTGIIMSTHSANPAGAPWNGPTVAGVDTVAQIRCSYCHDVHNLNRAAGDTVSGPPYLRGTWMGNPYREDGAPLATITYNATLNRFGAVPRGNTSSTALGGYQIDQNNGSPTATWTLASSAGLCTLCHGNNIDTLNQFGTAANAWIGSNGHSNAAIGGTGLLRANIFRNSDRSASPIVTGQTGAGNPTMAYRNALGDRGYGFRPVNVNGTEGWYLLPAMNLNDRPYGFNFYNWGATVDENTTDMLYHKFSCSKCHNPHASRLPRLLITNCLDTKHNTWDTKAGVNIIPNANSSVGTAVSVENRNTAFSNATSAQNCHRLRDAGNYPQARGSGWNRVSPWTTPGTQDNGTIP